MIDNDTNDGMTYQVTTVFGKKQNIRTFTCADDAREFYGEQQARKIAEGDECFITLIQLTEIDSDGEIVGSHEVAYKMPRRSPTAQIVTADPIIPFGQHRGKHFSQVNPWYLDSLLDLDWVYPNMKEAIARFLKSCPNYTNDRHQTDEAPTRDARSTPTPFDAHRDRIREEIGLPPAMPDHDDNGLNTPQDKIDDAARADQFGPNHADNRPSKTRNNGRQRPANAAETPANRLPNGYTDKENTAAHQRRMNRAARDAEEIATLEKECKQLDLIDEDLECERRNGIITNLEYRDSLRRMLATFHAVNGATAST